MITHPRALIPIDPAAEICRAEWFVGSDMYQSTAWVVRQWCAAPRGPLAYICPRCQKMWCVIIVDGVGQDFEFIPRHCRAHGNGSFRWETTAWFGIPIPDALLPQEFLLAMEHMEDYKWLELNDRHGIIRMHRAGKVA